MSFVELSYDINISVKMGLQRADDLVYVNYTDTHTRTQNTSQRENGRKKERQSPGYRMAKAQCTRVGEKFMGCSSFFLSLKKRHKHISHRQNVGNIIGKVDK